MPEFLKSAMERLSKTEFGVTFEATNKTDEKVKISQSQIIAEFLEHVRKITQVVIGEAVPVAELRDFLREQHVDE